MTRFFERGTALAEMEQQMMMVPNFAPRGYGSAILCRYRPTAADVAAGTVWNTAGGAAAV